jgi:hypothetical protein
MSDETTTADEAAVVDTPAPGTDTTQETQEQVNWEERYKEAQSWGTRESQKRADLEQQWERLESDDEALRQLLAKRGIELQDETPELPDDPTAAELAQFRKELEALKQSQTQSEQQQQLAVAEAHFASAFTALGEKRGAPLTEEEQNAVIGIALTMPAGANGLPPVSDAYGVLEKIREADQQKWAQTKRTTHRVSPNGTAGEAKPNMENRQERVAAMTEKFLDLSADS